LANADKCVHDIKARLLLMLFMGGCPARLINKLQLVQNAAARVLTRTRKYDHISSVLSTLHWLPIKHSINFKILLTRH